MRGPRLLKRAFATAVAMTIGWIAACGGRTGLLEDPVFDSNEDGEAPVGVADAALASRVDGADAQVLRLDAADAASESQPDVADAQADVRPDAADGSVPRDAGRDAFLAFADAGEDGRTESGRIDGEGPDAREAGTGPEASTGTLELVAGRLGGPGSQDGTGSTAGFDLPEGVAYDGAGNVFVADTQNAAIRKVVVATGAVTTFAGTAGVFGNADGIGVAASFSSPSALAFDGVGNLFVTDWQTHTIRQIVMATGEVTTLAGSAGNAGSADGVGSAARFSDPLGIAADNAGHLFVSDSASDTIREVVVATGQVTTIAGSPGLSGDADGVGPSVRFRAPVGLALDGAGHLWIADASGNTIRQMTVATGEVTTIAGSLAGTPGKADGQGTNAMFSEPTGIALDGAGSLLIVDQSNHSIRRMALATGEVTTLAGSGTAGDVDATGTMAEFSTPWNIAVDGTGDAFVADTGNQGIRQIVLASASVTTLAGGNPGASEVDGVGNAAGFSGPLHVASNGAGLLFVADFNSRTVRQVDIRTGAVSTLAGQANTPGLTDGVGTAAQFMQPCGVAADSSGDVFVSDQGGNNIRQIVVATGMVTTFAGSRAGEGGSADGIGTSATFSGPCGLATDGAGDVFVADAENNTIRQIVVATGQVTTVAGSTKGGSADGTGTNAEFQDPLGVAADGAGNLYVADTANNTIRKVVLATGEVTTIAGMAGTVGRLDGVGTAADFAEPIGLTLDGMGSLYVADSLNNAIRKVDLATGMVSTVVGNGKAPVVVGPLPGQLNSASGVAFVPPADLYITNYLEDVLLVARFF